MSTDVQPEHQVVLTRILRHPPARVFSAWTTAENLQRWMTPGRDTSMTAQVDCREGGEYMLTFRESDGTINRVGGRYLTVRAPERLVFTWVWMSSTAPGAVSRDALPLDAAGVETLVIVDFSLHPDGTLLTVTHQRFRSDREVARHDAGWTGALDQLPGYLEGNSGDSQ